MPYEIVARFVVAPYNNITYITPFFVIYIILLIGTHEDTCTHWLNFGSMNLSQFLLCWDRFLCLRCTQIRLICEANVIVEFFLFQLKQKSIGKKGSRFVEYIRNRSLKS